MAAAIASFAAASGCCLDVAQTADEQLDVVADALRGEAGAARVVKSRELAERLDLRSAA